MSSLAQKLPHFFFLFFLQKRNEFPGNGSRISRNIGPEEPAQTHDRTNDQRPIAVVAYAFEKLKRWIASESIIHPPLSKRVPGKPITGPSRSVMEDFLVWERRNRPALHPRGDLRMPILPAEFQNRITSDRVIAFPTH